MADDQRGPTPTQEQLAKEVLAGEREIIASEVKRDKEVGTMPDDPKMMQAVTEARAMLNESKQQAITMKEADVHEDVARGDSGGRTAPGESMAYKMQREAAMPEPSAPQPNAPEPDK